jgi:hypothetical protein
MKVEWRAWIIKEENDVACFKIPSSRFLLLDLSKYREFFVIILDRRPKIPVGHDIAIFIYTVWIRPEWLRLRLFNDAFNPLADWYGNCDCWIWKEWRGPNSFHDTMAAFFRGYWGKPSVSVRIGGVRVEIRTWNCSNRMKSADYSITTFADQNLINIWRLLIARSA